MKGMVKRVEAYISVKRNVGRDVLDITKQIGIDVVLKETMNISGSKKLYK